MLEKRNRSGASARCLVLWCAVMVTMSSTAECTSADAETIIFSGPQVSEGLSSFEILLVDGEADATKVDPIKSADGQPMVLIFVHQLTRPGMALTRAISGYAASQKARDVRCYIVWLDDDQAAAEAYLRRAFGSLQFVVPVGVSVDGEEGPGAYGLNRNVELTILVANKNQVTANFALVQPSLTEAAEIASPIAALIDQSAPDQKQLEALAYPRGQAMRRGAGNRGTKMKNQPDTAERPSRSKASK